MVVCLQVIILPVQNLGNFVYKIIVWFVAVTTNVWKVYIVVVDIVHYPVNILIAQFVHPVLHSMIVQKDAVDNHLAMFNIQANQA